MKYASVNRPESVQGELGLGTLPALIRRLHQERRTGTLHIRAGDSWRRVHFREGDVVFAGSDRRQDRLGHRLRVHGLVDPEMLREAGELQESSGKRFGECLVALRALNEVELHASVERQVRSIVTFLFSVSAGQYRFEEEDEPVQRDLILNLPMRDLLLDGIRSMDDPIALRIGVGAMTDYLHLRESSRESFEETSGERVVLAGVDGRTRVLDIVRASTLDEVETLRSICALLAIGIIEARSEPAGDS